MFFLFYRALPYNSQLGARDYSLVASTDVRRTQIDMDKLADNLQRLGEDDLLRVVQMVHDNKTPETYTKNDVERK